VNAAPLLAQILAPYVELSAGEISALAAPFSAVRYGRGEALFRAGDECHELVLLHTGLIRAYYLDAEAREVNLRFLAAPNVVTSMASLITGEPAREWVAAVTDTAGFRAPVLTVSSGSPHSDRLMRVLAEQHYLSMERRLRMLQHRHVRDRYAFYRAEMEPAIVDAMPDFHVASYLGVAPETLSRGKQTRARRSAKSGSS
jgi:CRP-like cAMP-binding protein